MKEAEDLFEEAEEAFDDEDFDDAIELAEEAEGMAEKAIDRIDEEEERDSDDIDEITAYVGDGEAEIFVEYENGDDDDFTVDSDDQDDIIEQVADELDVDEDAVEDLIEFRGQRVSAIYVEIDDGEAMIDIEFEKGDDESYNLDEDDEDVIVEKLARKLDLSEREVERLIDFD